MDNEETKVLNLGSSNQPNSDNQSEQPATPEPKKKSERFAKAAYAAGGFMAGLGSAIAADAFGADRVEPEEIVQTEEVEEETATPVVTEEPESQPEEVVQTTDDGETQEESVPYYTTDEGMRVAQVDDSMSFGEAFAEARAQVGAGGAFEWHGKVYGTYYQTEWNQMSSAERAEYQSRVDYGEILSHDDDVAVADVDDSSTHEHAYHHTDYNEMSHDASFGNEAQPHAAEYVDDSYENDDIVVVGAGELEMADGSSHNGALLAYGEDQALIVDVDDDGTFDVLIHDDNSDGQISYDEFHDIHDGGITYDDVNAQIEAQNNPDGLVAYNDDLPDYMNDADTGLYNA